MSKKENIIRIKNLVIFVAFFAVFFAYSRVIIYDNITLYYFVNSLIFLLFIASVSNIKYGLYTFIFFIPLLNTITTIIGIRPVSILLLLFFALFLGFLVNRYKYFDIFSVVERDFNGNKGIFFDDELFLPILLMIVVSVSSLIILAFRYANFFPFVLNRYLNLKVSLNAFDSNGAILWVVRYFFNYIIVFGLLLVIVNVIRKIKDIINIILILIGSAVLSFGVLLYQYFYNPNFGSFTYWVQAGRYNATFTDPNSLGAFTILVFPVFIGLIFYVRKVSYKIILSILIAPVVFMIILSGSRSALLGTSLSLLVF